MSNKRIENIRKLEEINKRLDDKAKVFYMAYKNNRLDLDKLNDDMKERVLKLEKEEKGNKNFNSLITKLKSEKINNINKAIDNLQKSNSDEDDIEEKEDELYEKIITKFDYFKVI